MGIHLKCNLKCRNLKRQITATINNEVGIHCLLLSVVLVGAWESSQRNRDQPKNPKNERLEDLFLAEDDEVLPEVLNVLDALNERRAVNEKRSCYMPGIRCAANIECCWDNDCVEIVKGDPRRKHCDNKVKGFNALSIKG